MYLFSVDMASRPTRCVCVCVCVHMSCTDVLFDSLLPSSSSYSHQEYGGGYNSQQIPPGGPQQQQWASSMVITRRMQGIVGRAFASCVDVLKTLHALTFSCMFLYGWWYWKLHENRLSIALYKTCFCLSRRLAHCSCSWPIQWTMTKLWWSCVVSWAVSSNVHTLVVIEYAHCKCKIEAVSIIWT